jgi:C1A family cysteine protease
MTIPTKPPTEAFMRELVSSSDEEATIYGSKSYATTTHNDIEWIAQMIRDNNGVVSGFIGTNEGWATADIRPPKDGEIKWGHAVYLIGAEMRNGKQAIKFINSWGENWGDGGYGYFYADSLGEMFDLWTLIDKINTMNRVIKTADKQDNWVIKDSSKFRIPDYETFSYFEKLGFIGFPETVEQAELDKYAVGEMLPSIKLTRTLEHIIKDIFLNE